MKRLAATLAGLAVLAGIGWLAARMLGLTDPADKIGTAADATQLVVAHGQTPAHRTHPFQQEGLASNGSHDRDHPASAPQHSVFRHAPG
ncbi:MAG: hypothetical protein WDN49_04575 [Acetobacteraceae bacterium]